VRGLVRVTMLGVTVAPGTVNLGQLPARPMGVRLVLHQPAKHVPAPLQQRKRLPVTARIDEKAGGGTSGRRAPLSPPAGL
jgi:hypothetical protein